MYPDDQFSTTSSQWTTTYKRLPKKQPLSLRFMSWAAGAPRGATVMKKKTRDWDADDRSQRSGGSSRYYFNDADTQFYWVSVPESRSYSSGSSSTSSRRSKKSKKHFEGTPMPRQPPPPPGFGMPAGGHFSPPPPPMGPPPMHMPMPMPMDHGMDPGMDDGMDDMDMMDDHMHMGGGYHGMAPPPPPPPPPMNGPPGGAPAFIDVTGQNQPGNPFQGGGGGYHSGMSSSGYDSDSMYSGYSGYSGRR